MIYEIMIQECCGVLAENKIFTILKKYRICPNEEFFVPLIDILQLRKDGNINYRELMKLLNWKHNLLDLPKIKRKLAIILHFFKAF